MARTAGSAIEDTNTVNSGGGLVQTYASAFPDVDTDSLEAHLALALASSVVAGQLQARINEMGFDLTRPRYTIVRMLYLSEAKALPQSRIAQLMGVSGPYVTQMIDSLEQDGWVERVVQRPDRRITSIKLTPEGTERCARLVPAIVDYMAESVSSLTADERRQLTDLCRKIRAHLGPPQNRP